MRSLWLVVVLAFAGCSSSEPAEPKPTSAPAPKRKDPESARKLIAGGAVVLDVRTPDEFAGGHLPNAINLPVQDFAARIAEVDKAVASDKSRPVVVYCASGARSAKAKAQLEAAGYTNVVNGGGLDDLQ